MSNKTKKNFMIMKRLYKDGNKTVYSLCDKSGYIKAKLQNKGKLDIGQVIEIEDNNEVVIDVSSYKIITNYKLEDYLPTAKMPMEDIMGKIEEISNKYITSPQAVKLNDYFFKDEEFLAKFKQCIGGVSMHHNYIGGLAEHTLHVMHLTQILCELYNCRRPEIAILSAKLHDIGKIHELFYEGPFKYTLEGELEGHIVIGIQMIDRALRECGGAFSEDFIRRIKGCITQHHGKIEYGSPKAANMEESFILNYADSIDATLNKINQLKESCEANNWSEYERKLDTRLYL